MSNLTHYESTRMALLTETGASPLSWSESTLLRWLKRTGKELRCHWCSRRLYLERIGSPHPYAPTVEHLLPLSIGGTNDSKNLAPACATCNSRRSNDVSWQPQHEWRGEKATTTAFELADLARAATAAKDAYRRHRQKNRGDAEGNQRLARASRNAYSRFQQALRPDLFTVAALCDMIERLHPESAHAEINKPISPEDCESDD